MRILKKNLSTSKEDRRSIKLILTKSSPAKLNRSDETLFIRGDSS